MKATDMNIVVRPHAKIKDKNFEEFVHRRPPARPRSRTPYWGEWDGPNTWDEERPEPVRRRSRTPILFRFFQKVTSRIHWGIWYGTNLWDVDRPKEISQPNTEARVIAYLNRSRDVRFLKRVSNKLYQSHLDRDVTLYFSGSSKQEEYTLAHIDIDVQKYRGLGTTQGAIDFAERLRSTLWPDLYSEPSSQGKGVAAYVLVHKTRGEGPEKVNKALDHLEDWLQRQARLCRADIEKVEVMGHCAVYQRERLSTGQNYVVDVQQYKLAKLPRGEGVLNTTILSVQDLLQLQIPDEPVDEDQDDEIIPNRSSRGGSLRLVSEDELALLPKYERLAGELIGGKDLETSGRQRVTAGDLAIFMMILKVLTASMNRDGTMPTARIAGLWNALYAEDQVERAFDRHRLTAMRDLLSSLDLLFWEDERYCPGRTACKWQASEELLAMMEAGTAESSQPTHTSLYGTPVRITGFFRKPRLVFALFHCEDDFRSWDEEYQAVERRLLVG